MRPWRKNIPFIVRLMPNVAFPKRIGAEGELWPAEYALGISDDSMWSKAAVQIKSETRWVSHLPAFFPRIFTSDDFSVKAGWDWSLRNRDRFLASTGMQAPVPSPFVGNEPPYANIWVFNQPKGTVSPDEPWLSFNRFLARDVLGAYNKKITDAVIEANPEARIGPIPGGMQWPVFSSGTGQYPPMNFGANGFNMISYYMYLNYWRPEIGYVYWTELARAGNRDLPTYVMPDGLFPEESYLWNNFYLMLAAGADGMSYFWDGEATTEFWSVSKDKSVLSSNASGLCGRVSNPRAARSVFSFPSRRGLTGSRLRSVRCALMPIS